ncbi:MAG: O-antigen ligase family protein [Henriciella sp.]|nr:O-antigen ligase family protein [Henriciella sp.]
MLWWRSPDRYAAILAGFFVLWPIVGYMGAQGYSPGLGLLAIASLFFLPIRYVSGFLFAVLATVLVGVAAERVWAGNTDLFQGNLATDSFKFDSAGMRLALTLLCSVPVFLAIRLQTSSPLSTAAIRWTIWVQGVGVVVTAVLMSQVVAGLAQMTDTASVTQNLLRNANAFLIVLPLLAAWVWHSELNLSDRATPERLAIALWVIAILAFALTGSQAAIVGAIFALILTGMVWRMPRTGFRVIFTTIAAYIAFVPFILAFGLSSLRQFGLPLPESFMSRSYSWELVGQKILENPVYGHGPEASKTWTDTFGDHPDWLAQIVQTNGLDAEWEQAWSLYRVIPGHPHNMPLQIWAETGMVGAGVVACLCLVLAWAVKPPEDWPPVSKYAMTGLIGAVLAMSSFSYSFWNEAFWASVIIATAAIWLQARQDRSEQ